MKILLVVNPAAGRQVMEQEEKHVRQRIIEDGHHVLTLHTRKDVHLKTQLAELLPLGIADWIVCAGGDGTLNQTVCALKQLGYDLPVGYIPAGTTNDFAGTLKLAKKPVEAAQQMLKGSVHRLDLGQFGDKDRYFIYVASFGAFTQTSYATTQSLKNTLGHLAYLMEGMREFPALKAYHVRVDIGEECFEDDYIFGGLTNTSSIGGVIRLSEDCMELDDGKFELILVKKPQNLVALSHITLGLMSGNYDPSVITLRQVTSAVFFSEEVMPWSLDGEFAQGGKNMEIQVLPKAYGLRF